MPIFSRFRYTAATIGRSDGCGGFFLDERGQRHRFARRQLERLRRLLHLGCEQLLESATIRRTSFAAVVSRGIE